MSLSNNYIESIRRIELVLSYCYNRPIYKFRCHDHWNTRREPATIFERELQKVRNS